MNITKPKQKEPTCNTVAGQCSGDKGAAEMKLYLLERPGERLYDTYGSAVVAAESEDAARLMHPEQDPDFRVTWCEDQRAWLNPRGDDSWTASSSWANPEDVKITELTKCANKDIVAGLICASYIST